MSYSFGDVSDNSKYWSFLPVLNKIMHYRYVYISIVPWVGSNRIFKALVEVSVLIETAC